MSKDIKQFFIPNGLENNDINVNDFKHPSDRAIIALGYGETWDVGKHINWHSYISYDASLNKDLIWEWIGSDIFLKNPEILEGIKMPELTRKYGRNEQIFYMPSNSCRWFENAVNKPEKLGFYSPSFGGYGSKIKNPFSIKWDKDIIAKYIGQICWTCSDVMNEKSTPELWMQEQLLEKIFKIAGDSVYEIGQGNYRGRSGRNKGIENLYVGKINDKTILSDLARAGLVCRIKNDNNGNPYKEHFSDLIAQ